eukprot:1159400-Pelagomonas_calceolata.AAC.1
MHLIHLYSKKERPSLPTFMYENVALPQNDQFKYLGILVDKHTTSKTSEEHAVQPYMAAQQRIKKFVHEHDLRNRPRALLWLSKVYGIPAGRYACQVWDTEYLQEGSEFKRQLQKRHLCSLRRFLGVKSTTTYWPVLRECGQEPLQFFNNMLDSKFEF